MIARERVTTHLIFNEVWNHLNCRTLIRTAAIRNKTLIFEAKIRNRDPQIDAKIRNGAPKLLLLKEIKFTHTTKLLKTDTKRKNYAKNKKRDPKNTVENKKRETLLIVAKLRNSRLWPFLIAVRHFSTPAPTRHGFTSPIYFKVAFYCN